MRTAAKSLPCRRVAVTGLGLLSPVGNDVSTAWRAMCNGRPGIDTIRAFEQSDEWTVRIAGEVRDWDPTAVIDPRELKRMDRFCALGLAAATEATMRWREENPEVAAAGLKSVALGRFGDAERDIGRAAVFLVGDAPAPVERVLRADAHVELFATPLRALAERDADSPALDGLFVYAGETPERAPAGDSIVVAPLRSASRPSVTAHGDLIGSSAADLRRAILLREILGPPVSLQSGGWSADGG